LTPFQTHYFSENLVVPGIEPRNFDHQTTEAVKNPFVVQLNNNNNDKKLIIMYSG
jgi:hypothetical protein